MNRHKRTMKKKNPCWKNCLAFLTYSNRSLESFTLYFVFFFFFLFYSTSKTYLLFPFQPSTINIPSTQWKIDARLKHKTFLVGVLENIWKREKMRLKNFLYCNIFYLFFFILYILQRENRRAYMKHFCIGFLL